jgi:hypothetical protein
MQRRILKHLANYDILSTEQYGFRFGLRTDNATYKLTTDRLNALNNKLLVGGIFFVIQRKHLIVLIMIFYYLNRNIMESVTRIFSCINLIWVTGIVE